MKKAVFLDVDGTIVSYSTNPHHIPEPTRQAIRLLTQKGHIVSLATGRSLATAGRVMRELGIINAVLCSGAHIIAGGEPLSVTHMEPGFAETVARTAAAAGCAVFACTEDCMYTENATEESLQYVREQSGRPDIVKPIAQMGGVCLMNLYGTALPGREFFAQANATVEKGYIEVRPIGISKATGVRMLAEHYGIPMEHTVAIGDGSNDVEMLRAAGVGIAVGNANGNVKAAADIVTEHIDDGGIYNALERLGLL